MSEVELWGDRTDQLPVGDRIGEPVLRHRRCQYSQKFVVPANPGEITLALEGPGGRVRGGQSDRFVLEMAGPDHLEGVETVEVDAPGGKNLEARVGVEHRLGKVHFHPAESVDHLGEGVEIEHDVVLDGDAQILVDGCHQLAGPLVQRGVDLVGSFGPGVRDEEIAGYRQDRQGLAVGIEVQDHHHVRVDPVHALRAQSVGGVLHLECATVGGTDQQDVCGTGIGPGRRDIDQSLDVEPVDPAVQVGGVSDGSADFGVVRATGAARGPVGTSDFIPK
jgi:hypothetical protein